MKLSQTNNKSPNKKKDILKLLQKQKENLWFGEKSKDIIDSLSEYDYDKCNFLRKTIKEKYKQVRKELELTT